MTYYKLVKEDNTFLTQKMIRKKYLLLVEENKMICKIADGHISGYHC